MSGGPQGRGDRPHIISVAVRIGVGLLGIAAVVVGIRAAWRADAATAVLIVGAVLIFLALVLNRNLEELSAKYKDASVTYRTRPMPLGEVADALSEAASVKGETDADPGAKLEDLRGEVREIASAVRIAADSEQPIYPWGPRTDSRFQQWARWLAQSLETGQVGSAPPELTYRLIRPTSHLMGVPTEGDEDFRISVSFRWSEGWRVVCNVTHQGQTWSRVVYGRQFMGGMNFSVTYPREFRGAPPLEPSTYMFTWLRPGAPHYLGQPEGQLLRRDALTITNEMLRLPESTAEGSEELVPSES